MLFDLDKFLTDKVLEQINNPLIPRWVSGQLDGGGVITTASSGISNALTGPAVLIALLFFLLSLVELGMSERMNVEMFTKFFAKFIAAFLLINATQVLIDNITITSAWINTEIQDANLKGISDASSIEDGKDGKVTVDGAEDIVNNLRKTINDMTWYERFLCYISGGAVKIFSYFGIIALLTLFISRKLELAVRGSFMSIAMAFIVQDGWNSGAIRYVKKYMALWLQGPAIAIVLRIATAAYLDVLSGIFASNGFIAWISKVPGIGAIVMLLGLPLAMMFAVIGACRGTMQIVNDVMGV